MNAEGADQLLDVLLSDDYPFVLPVIGFVAIKGSIGPSHRVSDKTLCLVGPGEEFALRDDETALGELIRRATEILTGHALESVSERNENEFIDYWRSNGASTKIVSAIRDLTEPRFIQVLRTGSGRYLAAETRKDVTTLFERRYVTASPVDSVRGVLLSASSGFPSTFDNGAEFYEYFSKNAPSQAALLESLAVQSPAMCFVLVALPHTIGGLSIVAALIRRPPGLVKLGRPQVPGFRNGHVPPKMAANAFFLKSASLEHANVARIDAAWVTTRGGSGFVKELSNAKLSVIGAGSLGGTVCQLLVKAGASHLRVLDPEVLTLDNIARHELGARYVGRAKATALAESLMRDYPYADVTANDDRWEDVERRRPGFIDESDVVISTTGNLASESQLNLTPMNRAGVRLRIYAWLEAYAAAAHCLVLLPGDCFGCTMDEFGLFKGSVTEFETEVVRVPGCADAFQPYGEIDAMPAKAFIARCIVDAIIAAPRASSIYTWIGARSILEKYSGAIRSSWLNAHDVPPEAGTAIVGPWERDPNCRLCQKVAS